MRDRDRALTLAEAVLKAASPADQAQVSVTISDASYARFARNYVIQNLASVGTQITLTYYVGKKSGSVSTDDASPASIARMVAAARDIARRVPPDCRSPQRSRRPLTATTMRRRTRRPTTGWRSCCPYSSA